MKIKKFIPIILTLLLTLSLCACAEKEETPDPVDIDNPGVTEEEIMTQDYQQTSNKYYELTGVQLPELTGKDADYEILSREHEEVAVEINGDEETFEELKASLTKELGKPVYEDSVLAKWEIAAPEGTKVHTLLYDVSAESDTNIYLNYYVKRGKNSENN